MQKFAIVLLVFMNSFSLPLSFLIIFLSAPLAWGDCGDPLPDSVVQQEAGKTKKITPKGKHEDGFYYLFTLKDSDVYFDLNTSGGISGEPIYSGYIYQIRKNNVTPQCLNEIEIGSYEFSVQPEKKTFTIYEQAGCNDHSEDDCKPVQTAYHYVWNGQAFYTTTDISTSKKNLKKLLNAVKQKDRRTISTLLTSGNFYPALAPEDVDDKAEGSSNSFYKSKTGTFAVINFTVQETLETLKSGTDPVKASLYFSQIIHDVFALPISEQDSSMLKIFPDDQAYTQLINDVGFTYQQLWEQLLKAALGEKNGAFETSIGNSFKNARLWLNSAKNRNPRRAVVYLNLSDLFRVLSEKKTPIDANESEALIKSQCFGSRYVELMTKSGLEKKVPAELTKFLGGKVDMASLAECGKFLP